MWRMTGEVGEAGEVCYTVCDAPPHIRWRGRAEELTWVRHIQPWRFHIYAKRPPPSKTNGFTGSLTLPRLTFNHYRRFETILELILSLRLLPGGNHDIL